MSGNLILVHGQVSSSVDLDWVMGHNGSVPKKLIHYNGITCAEKRNLRENG